MSPFYLCKLRMKGKNMELKFDVIDVTIPTDSNVIVGQSHFIKTVEDIYEAMITATPNVKFAVAFSEASGDSLIRFDGNDEELISSAIENTKKICAGHTFILLMRNCYPINVLKRIQNVQEVCNIFAATANPLQVIVAQTNQGRGIMGVIDGATTDKPETEKDKVARISLLKDIIGYKR